MAEYSIWQGARGNAAGAALWEQPSISMRASGARQASARADERFGPSDDLFWTRRGVGHSVILTLALTHVGIGLLVSLAGALWQYAGAARDARPAVTAALGAGLALLGLLTCVLARSARPAVALGARLLLPYADLAICGVALWLLGVSAIPAMVLLVPVAGATLLLSWRSGAALTALAVAGYGAFRALSGGTAALEQWIPELLALAGVATLLVFVVSAHAQALHRLATLQYDELTTQRDERKQHFAEQRRLYESLHFLERRQAEHERDRGELLRQASLLNAIAWRLSEGNLDAAQGLRPGMFGSLETLAASLARLRQRIAATLALRQSLLARQHALEAVTEGTREQTHLVAAIDDALHLLSAEANALVAEVRGVEPGSGALRDSEWYPLLQALQRVERRALAQASHTAVLTSRLAQLRGRQIELEHELDRLRHQSAPRPRVATPAFPSTPRLAPDLPDFAASMPAAPTAPQHLGASWPALESPTA
jgi:hypothetical protein